MIMAARGRETALHERAVNNKANIVMINDGKFYEA